MTGNFYIFTAFEIKAMIVTSIALGAVGKFLTNFFKEETKDIGAYVQFELVPKGGNKVEVKWIQAYPLRQGVGGRAMKHLQDLAQQDGISLTLYPWDKGVVKQGNLIKFYKKQGFKPTNKGSKNMYWNPNEEGKK